MNPKPQQAKLPEGYFLRKMTTGVGTRWLVEEQATGDLVVRNQPDPKTAVERALSAIAAKRPPLKLAGEMRVVEEAEAFSEKLTRLVGSASHAVTQALREASFSGHSPERRLMEIVPALQRAVDRLAEVEAEVEKL